MGMYKINDNGVIRDMTPYEIASLTAQEPEPEEPPISNEERIAALEVENAQLKEALDLLLSGATEEGEADV